MTWPFELKESRSSATAGLAMYLQSFSILSLSVPFIATPAWSEKPEFLATEDDALTRLQAGAATYRFALGPNKGKKALTIKTAPDTDHVATKGLVAKNLGFSLHAGVAMTGTERDKIEKLCRYITRPAIALERLSLNQRGQVVYTRKKPYDDGTTHIMMMPLELMERLAAIVPRPIVYLTRFAGVFAPHYKYRAPVVPKPRAEPLPEDRDKPHSNSRISSARLLKRVFNIDVEARGPPAPDPFAPQQHFDF